MKQYGGTGDSPPSAAVVHSDDFCKISAGSIPPGKQAHMSQICPRPLTVTCHIKHKKQIKKNKTFSPCLHVFFSKYQVYFVDENQHFKNICSPKIKMSAFKKSITETMFFICKTNYSKSNYSNKIYIIITKQNKISINFIHKLLRWMLNVLISILQYSCMEEARSNSH